jgi:hypothetical protein
MTRRILPLLALLLLVNEAAGAQEPVLVNTPRAQLLPVSPTNRPFLAAGQALQPVDLAARGYAESELRVSGRANVYDWASADAVEVRTADAPYVTRILVRQPRDAARFSGRVIVELLDGSAGYDAAPLWGLSWEYFTRHGDVWVGVTVQTAAAAALRRFDNVRYESLNLSLAQPETCSGASPDAGDGLAWDVIAQVGALLRSSSKENPLLVLSPQRIIAAGYARSGGYVLTYANALHARQRLGDGAPIFDGFLSAAATDAAPINPCAPALQANDARRGVRPRDVPFVAVLTESDLQGGARLRDDSDAPADVFRGYEIAGVGGSGFYAAGQPAAADLSIAGLAAPADGQCREPRSSLSANFVLNAIWQQYDELLLHQLPMNHEARIGVDAGGVLRDDTGNARGGWRLPQIDVPVAAYRGSSTPRADDARSRQTCGATGSAVPMNAAALKARYGSRAEYLRRFTAAVDEALRQRRVVAEDVPALRALAQRTPAF